MLIRKSLSQMAAIHDEFAYKEGLFGEWLAHPSSLSPHASPYPLIRVRSSTVIRQHVLIKDGRGCI